MTKKERLKAVEQLWNSSMGMTKERFTEYVFGLFKGAEAEAESRWISVEDSLPNKLECILARAIDKRAFMENEVYHQVVFLDHDNKFYQAGMKLFETVTHWQNITPINQQ